MREKSFESVAQKRARANQRNNYLKKERGELPRGDQPLPELISSSGAVYIPPPPPSKKVAFEAAIITSCLVSEDEDESSIIDSFFHASGSIFDEVNQEFYGEELPSSSSSSSIEEIDFTNFSEGNNALEGIVIGSDSSSSSSSWEDLELFGDGLMGILEDGSILNYVTPLLVDDVSFHPAERDRCLSIEGQNRRRVCLVEWSSSGPFMFDVELQQRSDVVAGEMTVRAKNRGKSLRASKAGFIGGADGGITALIPSSEATTCASSPGITWDNDTTEPTGKVLVLEITSAGTEGTETKVTLSGVFVSRLKHFL
eukprot:scaffold1884_cov127-Skeletonema_dohrnii-CCMP3373.AAC.4